MSLTIISPEKHVLKDTPATRFFRRILKTEDIITFFSVESGQWILAYWVNRIGRVVDEIDDLGTNFEKITPELTHQIRTCWGEVDWAAKKKFLLSKNNEKLKNDQEELIQDQERWDWAKKKLNGKIPYLIKTPTGQ